MRSTYLVALRDYLGYVTAWGFWLGLLFTPVLLGVFMLAPSLAASSQPARYFAVIDHTGEFNDALRAELSDQASAAARLSVDPIAAAQGGSSEALEAFDAALESGVSVEEALAATGQSNVKLPKPDYVEITPPADTIEGLRTYLTGEQMLATPSSAQPLFAVFIVSDDGSEIQYWSENLQARGLMALGEAAEAKLAREKVFSAANVSPQIIEEVRSARRAVTQQRLRAPASSAGTAITIADRAPFIVSIAMAFMLWFLIFSVINYLLMGTIEERSNKIFDSLLTSVKLPNLLAGKLLAVLALALTLMAFWGLGSTAVGYFASQQLGPDASQDIKVVLNAIADPWLVIPAVISFVLGYLMYGSLFLALGSLCDTIQEAQTLMTPLIVLLMTPLFMLVFAINDAQSPIIEAMVWIPIFTPFLLILRMPTDPPLWEVLAQLGLMAMTAALVLYLATRVYRAGAVHGAGVGDVTAFFGKLVPGRKKNVG